PLDFKSDQFALGSILYEMATGKRAFQRGTQAETMTAIIREEPEPIVRSAASVPAPFRWIVERCLQKDPDERYASTRDLARDLNSVRAPLSGAWVWAEAAAVPSARPRRPGRYAVAALALLAMLAAGVLLGRRTAKPPQAAFPTFHKLTFRRGEIFSARFAP